MAEQYEQPQKKATTMIGTLKLHGSPENRNDNNNRNDPFQGSKIRTRLFALAFVCCFLYIQLFKLDLRSYVYLDSSAVAATATLQASSLLESKQNNATADFVAKDSSELKEKDVKKQEKAVTRTNATRNGKLPKGDNHTISLLNPPNHTTNNGETEPQTNRTGAAVERSMASNETANTKDGDTENNSTLKLPAAENDHDSKTPPVVASSISVVGQQTTGSRPPDRIHHADEPKGRDVAPEAAKNNATGAIHTKLTMPLQGELPHVLFDDLRYRRVCARVHSSILCLVIRYPIDLPLQNASVSYPSPVDNRFYDLTKSSILDGLELDKCRNGHSGNSASEPQQDPLAHPFWKEVHSCLEMYASALPPNRQNTSVLAVMTRQTAHHGLEFYGTRSQTQRDRVHDFFGGQRVVLYGASPTPQVANGISQLFDNCTRRTHYRWECQRTSKNGTSLPVDATTTTTTLQAVYYHPKQRSNGMHDLHSTSDIYEKSLPAIPYSNHSKNSTEQEQRLSNLSVIVEFPFAHCQTQKMLERKFNLVKYNMIEYTDRMVGMLGANGTQRLAQKGWKLQRFLAFDGLPQHFPTKTNGYEHRFDPNKGLEQGKLPGWRPEFGHGCVGPLPPNNILKSVMLLARHRFEEFSNTTDSNGHVVFDGNFYGRVWEFSNQYWWQMRGKVFGSKGWRFDCTHYKNTDTDQAEGWQIHKFFVQAMIDDHYEALMSTNGTESSSTE